MEEVLTTYYIKTFGCQANIADSSTMAGILESLGFVKAEVKSKETDAGHLFEVLDKAKLLIINTCSVRQKSEDKVYGIGKFVKLHKDSGKEKPFIVMSGCMVGSVTGDRQRDTFVNLQRKTPWADTYINPSQIADLPKILLENNMLGPWAQNKLDFPKTYVSLDEKDTGFVNISYGCDNFCAFCVVPYARGKELSRPREEIVREVAQLISRGYSSITLCGQNVNSWGLGTTEKFELRAGSDHALPFASLLREIHQMDGLASLSFISSNPFDFSNDLIETLCLPKISNYLHMALQSGNNEVLKRMNRRHTVEDFLTLVASIRAKRKDIELGTDIIVGFPGETHDQFMDTVKVFEQVKFKNAFISMYSARVGTPSQKYFKDDVSVNEKKWRHAYLTKIWKENR